ncbi:hypothetical protein ACVRZH_06515 [Streptococcus fryi]
MVYDCSFVDFQKAKAIYDAMDDADDIQFSKLARLLNKQVVRISRVETLSE